MSQLPEWCSKKQTAKIISRTERTVSRIVRDAVEKRTNDILANLKLVYADGEEVLGRDVTVELLAKNEQQGSRTRWFFRRVWWKDDFAQRINETDDSNVVAPRRDDESRDESPAGTEVGQQPMGDPPPLPVDPAVRAVVLEHLHFNDRKHAAEIRQLTDRVLQVVETNQQLQGQTNTLYNQFQETFKQSGGLKALIEGPAGSEANQGLAKPHANERPPLGTVVEVQPQDRPGERLNRGVAKRARPKPKLTSSRPASNKDAFPTFRRFARFLRRK
jgi:hypothetical protein